MPCRRLAKGERGEEMPTPFFSCTICLARHATPSHYDTWTGSTPSLPYMYTCTRGRGGRERQARARHKAFLLRGQCRWIGLDLNLTAV